MSAEHNTLAKIPAETAKAVIDQFGVELEVEAAALLGPEASPKEFLRALLEAGHDLDAVRFLAHALEPTEAVWWACTCARQALGAAPEATDMHALEAAETWVRSQDEESSRAAEAAAAPTGLESAAGVAAQAAFLSADNIAPPDADPVPPPQGVGAKLVAAAVVIAGVTGAPEQADERYRAFLAKGIEIAMGAPIGTPAA
jgi:hypothetical protein